MTDGLDDIPVAGREAFWYGPHSESFRQASGDVLSSQRIAGLDAKHGLHREDVRR
jgi:hypothetical protein